MPPIPSPPSEGSGEEPRWGFFDATCTNCKRKVGWSGSYLDRPPCPRCGHKLTKEELEEGDTEDREHIEAMLRVLRDRDLKRKLAARLQTKAQKVAHVKAAKQERDHRCHWPGCPKQVPPAMWGCREHWFRLPKRLRDKVWAAYRAGQEESGTPSLEYLQVAREVREWILANFPESVF